MSSTSSPFAKLREPFPADKIERLPRAANKAAKEANKKGNCSVCGKYHVLPAIHLDYVSHATVTDRLLSVDPEWTWEPMARDERGPHIITNDLAFSDPDARMGLWIILYVAGTSTPGFGEGKNIKECISDAVRNAAMRRGVALDLWAKVDLDATPTEAAAAAAETPPPEAAGATSDADPPAASTPPPIPMATDEQREEIVVLIGECADAKKDSVANITAALEAKNGPLVELTRDAAKDLIPKLKRHKTNLQKAKDAEESPV